MRDLIKGPLLIVLLSTALTASGAAQTLDEKLKILVPLIGHSWEGHFQDTSDEARPTITMSLEPMLAGKAVRLVSGGFGMTRENIYYWDPETKQICYVALTSNGWVSTGVAYAEGSVIVTIGRQVGPDGTGREVKNTWEATSDGKVVARGYSKETGSWKPGHVIVFVAGPPEPSSKE